MHRLLVIPGLGDNRPLQTKFLKWALEKWRKHGIFPEIHTMNWHDKKESFEYKKARLLAVVDSHAKNGDVVSVLGMSAGASAALNVFFERRDVVKTINVVGRLRSGNHSGFRSLENRSHSSPAFRESVLLFEKREPGLSKSERKRIMTVRALFGDELVPADTTTLEGAYNISIPSIEHMLSGALAMTLFSRRIIDFLRK